MTELLIQENQEKKQIALVENGKLIEYYEEDNKTNRREGNIYIGIVKDIIKGMQAAFVDIGTEKNSFIHLKDILPTLSEEEQLELLSTNGMLVKRPILETKDKVLVGFKEEQYKELL